MCDTRRQDERIETVLRQTHRSVQPVDSWEALRGRIDSRLDAATATARVIFWRRIALAAAACFAVTSLLLGYVTLRHARPEAAPVVLADADPPLLDDAQIERLTQAFAQVRNMFAERSPWFMIDSLGNSQLGLSEPQQPADATQRVIVVRLALRDRESSTAGQYADLVAFPRQRVDVRMQTAQGAILELSLVSVLQEDGRVSLRVAAQSNGDAATSTSASLDARAFRPLVRLRTGARWVDLGATAQAVLMAERG
jgi:hypothetical protein